MKLTQAVGALALLAAATVARADFSITPALYSDYDFRGISLNARDPAPQISFDYAHSSGFGAGLWFSQTDFGDPDVDVEMDVNLSYNGAVGDAFNWGAGLTYYTYFSGSDYNYPEIWVGISKKFNDTFSGGVKLWYSNDYNATDESATYLEANGRFELPKNFGFEVHVARSQGDYWDLVNGDGYTDFSVGFTYSWKDTNFALKYVDGSDLPDLGVDLLSTESKVVFSVSKTFAIGGK